MTDEIKELKDQLQAMLDATEDKPSIERIGTMNSLIDKIEAKHNKLQEEQKDLLKDYKELYKHTSFKPNGTEQEQIKENKKLTFDDFLSGYKKGE